jgi:hypothetical protein
MNNISSEMNKELNAGTVTTRQFAKDNNLNVLTLRGFLQNEDTIRPAFTRSRINYYNLERLTNWLNKNIWRFNGKEKNVDNQARDFFCTRDTVYKPIELRRRNGCCVDCIEKARNRVIVVENEEEAAVRVHTVKTKIDDIAAARLLKDNITDSWMNEF